MQKNKKRAIQGIGHLLLFCTLAILAIECGLRANHFLHNRSFPNSSSQVNRFTIVSLGNSVSANYPTVLRLKMQPLTDSLPLSIMNLYNTAPNRGQLPETISTARQSLAPKVMIIMLDGDEFTVAASSWTTLEIFTEHSLLARILIAGAYATVNRIVNQYLSTNSKDQLHDVDAKDHLEFLMSKTCCSESGPLQIRARLNAIQSLQIKDQDNPRLQIASFLAYVLLHDFDRAEVEFQRIQTIPPTLKLSKDDLYSALKIERGQRSETLQELKRRLEHGGELSGLSDFICSLATTTSRAINNKELESFFILECSKKNPESATAAFYFIDFLVRNNNHSSILEFEKRLPALELADDKKMVGRIYYMLGVYFLTQQQNFQKAKHHFEKSLHFRPGARKTIAYYKEAIQRLGEQVSDKMLPPTMPKADKLETESATDYPISYLKAFEQLCQHGVRTLILNYPNQPIEPIKRGLQDITCLEFIDTRSILNEARASGQQDNVYLQSDGLHFTSAGDELIAQALCRKIKQIFPVEFGRINCTTT